MQVRISIGATAAKIYGVPLEAVTDDRRHRQDGQFRHQLRRQRLASSRTELSRSGAQSLSGSVFRHLSRHPPLRGHRPSRRPASTGLRQRRCWAGGAATIPDRRRAWRPINEQMGAGRAAINHPIQGSAAGIIRSRWCGCTARAAQAQLEGVGWSCRCTTSWCFGFPIAR